MVIKFEECNFENNTSQNDFFNVRNTYFVLINSLFKRNKGRVLSGSHFKLIFENIYIDSHICFQQTYEGCVLFLQESGIANISNMLINNIDGNYFKDIILIKFSILEMKFLSLKNVITKNEISFLTCMQSDLYLRGNFLNKLNFSFASLFDNSGLFVFNNSFNSIINLKQISLIYCLNCKNVFISKNLFFRCSFANGGSLSFISSNNFLFW